MSPIYQTSSTKVQPVQPQVLLNSVPVNQTAATGKEMKPATMEPCGLDRAGSPTVGKPALPPKPPPPLGGKTTTTSTTPPPPPRQNAYHLPHQYLQQSTEDYADNHLLGRAVQQKDLTPPPRIPNGAGPIKSNFAGNSIDSSESDNSSSSASIRSMFVNMK